MTEWPSKGDLVFIPQKVQMVRFDKQNHPEEGIMVEKPTLALVYENNGFYCDVVLNNQIWSVPTEKLNKGEKYASKTDRSV